MNAPRAKYPRQRPERASDSARQARSRARRIAEGCRDLRVMLSPEAADKLRQWEAAGLTAREGVNLALVESLPPA